MKYTNRRKNMYSSLNDEMEEIIIKVITFALYAVLMTFCMVCKASSIAIVYAFQMAVKSLSAIINCTADTFNHERQYVPSARSNELVKMNYSMLFDTHNNNNVITNTVEEKKEEINKEEKKENSKSAAPTGHFNTLYQDMINQAHLLIAGETGSGKSVTVNGLMYHILGLKKDVKVILIDPKRTELVQYRNINQCLKYACDESTMIDALREGYDIMMNRFDRMQMNSERKSSESDIYIVIDEMADLLTNKSTKKEASYLLQRICQLGRAANVHVIACTQYVLRSVLPTEIRSNFTAKLGLRTDNAQASRNILDEKGCEQLPLYGYGIYKKSGTMQKYKLPMYSDDDIQVLIDYYSRNNNHNNESTPNNLISGLFTTMQKKGNYQLA